ncbi:hypothetical protein A4H97_03275 [Niastella yeongjuensis]|uniref:Uncharacterized protein n=1 Tax=Niastella yeongjuensis TaxID=354355 RepID=A0A1V9EXM2_9BACT|nr:hypothetical protein A4H97_03275 [Niastella yeongjuensis]
MHLLLSAPNGGKPQTVTSVPFSYKCNKISITSYSYEVVPIMFNAAHRFAGAWFMFFPIMQSKLAQNPELNQYPGL